MTRFVQTVEAAVRLGRGVRAVLSRRDVLFSLAMLAAIYGAWPVFEEAFTPPDFSRYWRRDCDLVLIHKGLVEHPRLRDTLEWWTGTWVGQVPFWRPLTSLLFWCEWKLFGWDNQDAWMLVHGLSWLLTTAALFLFVERIAKPWAAALAVVYLSVPRRPWLPVPIARYNIGSAVFLWKNSPDLWLALAGLLALWGMVSERPLLSVASALAAAAIKETGFVLGGATVVFWSVRRRTAPAVCAALLLSLMAAVKLRGVGIGFVQGELHHPLHRLAPAVLPTPLVHMLTSMAPFALLGMAILAGIMRRTVPAAMLLLFAVGTAIAIQKDLACAFAMLVDEPILTVSIPVALWGFAVLLGLSWQAVALWSLATVIAGIVAVVPQVTAHAYFFPAVLYAAAVGSVWCKAWQRFAQTFTSPNRHGVQGCAC